LLIIYCSIDQQAFRVNRNFYGHQTSKISAPWSRHKGFDLLTPGSVHAVYIVHPIADNCYRAV